MTDEETTASPGPAHRVVVTVHGIRTYGRWQETLEQLLRDREPNTVVLNYHYGYFSVVAFLLPPLRWITTLRFRRWLRRTLLAHSDARIDIVAHSFGTHLVGWSLYRLAKTMSFRIHTVILAGSVLKPGFPWDALMQPGSVHRIVNECGTKDGILVINQLVVLFTGMAGRVGFAAGTHERFRNRYHAFGHSGYFQGAKGRLSPEFMKLRWIPLLTTDHSVEIIDERPDSPGALQGLFTFLLNNAEPVKVAVYSLPFVALSLILWSLWWNARNHAYRSDIIACESRIRLGDYHGARELLENADRSLWGWEASHLQGVLNRSSYRGTIDVLPDDLLASWRSSALQVSYEKTGKDGRPAGVYEELTGVMLDPSLYPPGLDCDSILAASPDQRMLAALLEEDLELRAIHRPDAFYSFDGFGELESYDRDCALGFSLDGRLLAVLGTAVQEVWDVSDFPDVTRIPLEPAGESGSSSGKIYFGPLGKTLVYSGADSVHIWDVEARSLVFSVQTSEHERLTGTKYFVQYVDDLAFDVNGKSIFIAMEGSEEADVDIDDTVTVLACGTRTRGSWVFEERLVTDLEAPILCRGARGPEHLVFATGEAVYALWKRNTPDLLRLPYPAESYESILWMGFDDVGSLLTLDTAQVVRSWDLRPVASESTVFAAREWGFSYPLPRVKFEEFQGVEGIRDEGILAFGSLQEDFELAIMEHGLLDGGFRQYELSNDDLPFVGKYLESAIVDVALSPDGSRLHALVLASPSNELIDPLALGVDLGRMNAHVVDWDRSTGQQVEQRQVHPLLSPGLKTRPLDEAHPERGLVVVDAATGTELLRTDAHTSDGFRDLASIPPRPSPDGRRTVEFSEPSLLLRSSATGKVLLTLQPDFAPTDFFWASDGGWIVALAAREGESFVQIWDSAATAD